MKNEVSLDKVNNGIFRKIMKSIKKFLSRFSNKSTDKTENIVNTSSELSDFDILKGLVEDNIELKELDEDVKERLIIMCNTRLNEVNKKIKEKDNEIKKLKKAIFDVSNF